MSCQETIKSAAAINLRRARRRQSRRVSPASGRCPRACRAELAARRATHGLLDRRLCMIAESTSPPSASHCRPRAARPIVASYRLWCHGTGGRDCANARHAISQFGRRAGSAGRGLDAARFILRRPCPGSKAIHPPQTRWPATISNHRRAAPTHAPDRAIASARRGYDPALSADPFASIEFTNLGLHRGYSPGQAEAMRYAQPVRDWAAPPTSPTIYNDLRRELLDPSAGGPTPRRTPDA